MSLRGRPATEARPEPAWRRDLGDTLLFVMAAAAYGACALIGTAAYLQNIWTSARRGDGGWMIGELLMPPVGMLRGILIWLGVA